MDKLDRYTIGLPAFTGSGGIEAALEDKGFCCHFFKRAIQIGRSTATAQVISNLAQTPHPLDEHQPPDFWEKSMA